jgi:hypothetical protein
MAPSFLTLDEILEIHKDQITRYGGVAGILTWPSQLPRLRLFAVGLQASQ